MKPIVANSQFFDNIWQLCTFDCKISKKSIRQLPKIFDYLHILPIQCTKYVRKSVKIAKCGQKRTKVHSFLKQCLHNLRFMKTRQFSPNLSRLALADISWSTLFSWSQKTLFQTEWILVSKYVRYKGNKNKIPSLIKIYRKHTYNHFMRHFVWISVKK